MTKNEIVAMNPGVDLDDLVAEKIMGWRRLESCPQLHPTEVCNMEQVPKYSTDMAEAWKVVEEMKKQGLDFYFRSSGDEWLAQFTFKYGCGYIAKTAPEAICKAALFNKIV